MNTLRRRLFTTSTTSHPSSKLQIYTSQTTNPLLNLSLEHRLLQSSHPDSTILLLYVNRPCVVFGRNQNPWLEINLSELAARGKGEGSIDLVRRRSGGGTVFHDEGNVNFSVICPPGAFHRDTHAEMVVRALRKLGREGTRVNERHDIVMDTEKGTFKVSGSAYKLTRLRSLHHGTCLLSSPNLGLISPLLRSPAEKFMKAQGVDSVRSPVANVGVNIQEFKDAVVQEFEGMYGTADVRETFAEDALEDEKIAEGVKELSSREWLYNQTPRFVFSTHATSDDPRPRPSLPFSTSIHFEAKKGIIEKFNLNDESRDDLIGVNVADVQDWSREVGTEEGGWMEGVLGAMYTRP